MTDAHPDEGTYDYRPEPSAETDQVPMRSRENPRMSIKIVDTPRVGTDGLREALKKKYGVKQTRPA
jgi:hypothetical protein